MSSQNVCASTLISIYRCKWHETVKSERAVYGSGRISIQLTHHGFFSQFWPVGVILLNETILCSKDERLFFS